MSRLTPCNYDNLQWMRKRAAARGVEVIIETVPAGEVMVGWISARYSDEDKAHSFFQVLPDHCVCDE